MFPGRAVFSGYPAANLLKQAGEDGRSIPLEMQVCYIPRQGGLLCVDFDDHGSVFLGNPWNVAGGGDLRRGADHKKDAAGPGLFLCLFLRRPRDRLAEKHDIRLEDRAARAAGGYPFSNLPKGWISLPAANADEFPGVPVIFDHVAGAGRLVEAVHVLGDDGPEDSDTLQLREGEMRGIGSSASEDFHHLGKHFPDFFRSADESADGRVFFGIETVPHPLRSAERGDAALNGNSSSGQGDRFPAGDELFCRLPVGVFSFRRQFLPGSGLQQRFQLQGKPEIAGDLELPRHERHLPVELA